MWAGAAPAYPSVVYATWGRGEATTAKLSVGSGELTTNAERIFDEPVEAWWLIPAGSATLKLGKYFVPLAAQEWEYETKWGAMLQGSRSGFDTTLSANYNKHAHRMNGYARVARSVGSDASVGLSVATGRGLAYGTTHDFAWGVDASAAVGGWRVATELLRLGRRASDNAYFAFAKVGYEKLGAWQPWLGIYAWNDESGDMGRFRSTVYGLNYTVSDGLALEGAVAPTSDGRVSWLQLHWTWEK
jgi:hypothetical protein